MTREELLQFAQENPSHADWAYSQVAKLDADSKNQATKQGINSLAETASRTVGNIAGGLASGVTKGGAAMVWPIDYAQDVITGDRKPSVQGLITGEQPLSRHQERLQGINDFYGDRFDVQSPEFKGGEFAGELSGAVANPAIAGRTVAAYGAPRVGALLASGGSDIGTIAKGEGAYNLLGRAGARFAGGAASGAMAEGMSDKPSGQGLAISSLVGGSVPLASPVLSSSAKFLHGLASESGPQQRAALNAIEAAKSGINKEVDPSELAQMLRNYKLSVAGEQPTAGQMLDNAGVSGMERTLRSAYPMYFSGKDAASESARLSELLKHAGTKESTDAMQQQANDYAEQLYGKVGDTPMSAIKDLLLPKPVAEARRILTAKGANADQAYDPSATIRDSVIGGTEGRPVSGRELFYLKKGYDVAGRAERRAENSSPDVVEAYNANKRALMESNPDFKAANEAYAQYMQPINQRNVAQGLADILRNNKSFANEATGAGSTGVQGENSDAFIRAVRNADETYPDMAGFEGFTPDKLTPEAQESIQGVMRSLEGKKRLNAGVSGTETTAHATRINEMQEAGIPDAAKNISYLKKAGALLGNPERDRKALAYALANPLEDKTGLAAILEAQAKRGEPLTDTQKALIRLLHATPTAATIEGGY